MNIFNRYFIVASITILITACSILPDESTTNVEWQKHNSRLVEITSFHATGKIGYRGPNETVSLNLNWQHAPQESELRLINFLGSTVLNLTMTENGAKVVADDQVFEDSNPNLLFSRLTGMAFPVTQMKHWIKGLPYQADTQSFNEQNTLQSLIKQSGNRLWTLNYDRYQDVDGLPLPYQMTLSSEDTRIKIVVSKWKINP